MRLQPRWVLGLSALAAVACTSPIRRTQTGLDAARRAVQARCPDVAPARCAQYQAAYRRASSTYERARIAYSIDSTELDGIIRDVQDQLEALLHELSAPDPSTLHASR